MCENMVPGGGITDTAHDSYECEVHPVAAMKRDPTVASDNELFYYYKSLEKRARTQPEHHSTPCLYTSHLHADIQFD